MVQDSSANSQNESLVKEIVELRIENAHLRERCRKLKERVNKNSQNSSKPPSSDGYQKPGKNGDAESDIFSFNYAAVHVLCNAHHLREELQGVVDKDGNQLALRLMKFLRLSWCFCKKYKAAGMTQMSGAIRDRIEDIYDRILQRALTKEAAYMETQRQELARKKGITASD